MIRLGSNIETEETQMETVPDKKIKLTMNNKSQSFIAGIQSNSLKNNQKDRVKQTHDKIKQMLQQYEQNEKSVIGFSEFLSYFSQKSETEDGSQTLK